MRNSESPEDHIYPEWRNRDDMVREDVQSDDHRKPTELHLVCSLMQ